MTLTRRLLVVIAAGVILAGCTTTQQEAARVRLNGDRIRASQVPTFVVRRAPTIAVGPVSLIAGSRRSAVVVSIRNLAGASVSDLPISVGYREHSGRLRYLNASSGIPYFGNHLPAILAHGTLSWVFTTLRRIPDGAHLFAIVGPRSAVPASPPSVLPEIVARLVRLQRARHGGAELWLSVANDSSIPQYQLPVFAYAVRAGRAVAAGGVTIASLSGGANVQIRLRLVGNPSKALVRFEARATIYD